MAPGRVSVWAETRCWALQTRLLVSQLAFSTASQRTCQVVVMTLGVVEGSLTTPNDTSALGGTARASRRPKVSTHAGWMIRHSRSSWLTVRRNTERFCTGTGTSIQLYIE